MKEKHEREKSGNDYIRDDIVYKIYTFIAFITSEKKLPCWNLFIFIFTYP